MITCKRHVRAHGVSTLLFRIIVGRRLINSNVATVVDGDQEIDPKVVAWPYNSADKKQSVERSWNEDTYHKARQRYFRFSESQRYYYQNGQQE